MAVWRGGAIGALDTSCRVLTAMAGSRCFNRPRGGMKTGPNELTFSAGPTELGARCFETQRKEVFHADYMECCLDAGSYVR